MTAKKTAKVLRGDVGEVETKVKVLYKDENGKQHTDSFFMTFKQRKRSQFKSSIKSMQDDLDDNGIETTKDVDTIVEDATRWRGFTYADNSEVPFTEKVLRDTCESPPYFDAIWQAWLDVNSPGGAGRAKN